VSGFGFGSGSGLKNASCNLGSGLKKYVEGVVRVAQDVIQDVLLERAFRGHPPLQLHTLNAHIIVTIIGK
jgi:hypothetical protein